jgi:hypothetical protein
LHANFYLRRGSAKSGGRGAGGGRRGGEGGRGVSLAGRRRRGRRRGRLAVQRQSLQVLLVHNHLQVVEVGLDPPHHLRLLEHLFRVGRCRRLLPSFYRRRLKITKIKL